MSTIKKICQTFSFIILSLLLNKAMYAQGAMKVFSGITLVVQSATTLNVTNNFEAVTGASVQIYGDVIVGSTVTCTDVTTIVVNSTSASNQGPFIFTNGTLQATVERFITKDGWHQVSIPFSSGATTADFQRASKVRSTERLKVHLFGEIAVDFIKFISKPQLVFT